MRYLIRFSYDGSKFFGFQRLNDKMTVQKTLEDALTVINGNTVVIKGAGRTDRGVHAYGQCAHFDLDRNFSIEKLKYVLNKMVNPYIVINEVIKVNDSFHARFDVKEKVYEYRVYKGSRSPFLEDYSLFYPYPLDIEKMKEGALVLTGFHNYQNFVAGKRDSYDCVIDKIEIVEDDNMLVFRFYGKAFYRYMVRKLVGALLSVGKGSVTIFEIKEALDKPLVKKEFITVPSKGLYLTKIDY